MNNQDQETSFKTNGISWARNALSSSTLSILKADFESLSLTGAGARQSGLPDTMLENIYQLDEAHNFAKKLIGDKAKLVRIIAFDKTPQTNWAVPWHQDRTIAVKEKHEISPFGPWSQKGTLHHVEPPISLMNHMVTLRLHIDPCHITNGPLKTLPGSHRLGRIPQSEVLNLSKTMKSETCIAEAGDILAMHALTIHKSPKAEIPNHRRVLHMEYCSQKLPELLEWAMS
ncbi:MAG: phytanoyl-CoA dioxygenase family protein [Methyloligellaceae bacterium]